MPLPIATALLSTLTSPGLTASPALAPTVAAEETIVLKPFGWTYLEANFLWSDFEEVDQEFTGFEGRVSWEILLNFFLQGSYAQSSDDADLDEFRIGAGYHLGLGDRFDVYGMVSWANVEVDGGGVSADEDGTEVEVGARFWLGERIELNAAGVWLDLEDSEVGVDVGARFYLTGFLSVGANATLFDDVTRLAAGARFQF